MKKSLFKSRVDEYGFLNWVLKICFLYSLKETVSNFPIDTKSQKFHNSIITIILPIFSLFLILALTGFSIDVNELTQIGGLVFIFVFIILFMRFLFHIDLGIVKDGEGYYYLILVILCIPTAILITKISLEYNDLLFIALFKGVFGAGVFLFITSMWGSGLILGKD